MQLLDALDDVKGIWRDDLTPEERQLLTQAHDFIRKALRQA